MTGKLTTILPKAHTASEAGIILIHGEGSRGNVKLDITRRVGTHRADLQRLFGG